MENLMKIIRNQSAQFMLLAGFIIAIGLVITTVILNSIIFEVNTAIGTGIDPLKNDLINLMQLTKDEVRSAYSYGGNFSRQMIYFSGNISKIYALHGEGVSVSWDASNWNNGRYANFTDNGMADGAANWTVIENVTDSRINITLNTTDGKFQIGLINLTNPSWINLTTTGTFSFGNATTSDPYSIIFKNGSSTSGNYTITGTASGRNFIRARDYLLNATITLSTSRVRINVTIPVPVPW